MSRYGYDDLVNEVIRLREEANAARQRLMEFLYEIKNDSEKLSLITGQGMSFKLFVESIALVRLRVYMEWEEGWERIGKPEVARRIGTEATRGVTRLVNVGKTDDYISAVDAWIEEKNGATPSQEKAKTLACQIDPRAEVPAAVRSRTEKEKLKAELSRAKAEVKKLRAENRSLKKKLEKLERTGKSASKRGGSRKPSRTAA